MSQVQNFLNRRRPILRKLNKDHHTDLHEQQAKHNITLTNVQNVLSEDLLNETYKRKKNNAGTNI